MACPVEHSMSPAMHNLYAEDTGVDLVYVPFRVSDSDVGAAVKGACALNLLGMNVTVPHKQRVMEYLTAIDADAAAIGAVNTLVRTEGGYKGYNTDADGLHRAMKRQHIAIAGEACVLLGAGGAAKAAAYLLVREGAESVTILNRSADKAEALAGDINARTGRSAVSAMSLADWRKLPKHRYLAIQTTSVGMHPDVDAAPIEEPDFYHLLHTAVDIVYTPANTRFMKLAAGSGAKVMNGLDMLIYQGIIAYELWNPGVCVSEETAERARKMMIRHLGGSNG